MSREDGSQSSRLQRDVFSGERFLEVSLESVKLKKPYPYFISIQLIDSLSNKFLPYRPRTDVSATTATPTFASNTKYMPIPQATKLEDVRVFIEVFAFVDKREATKMGEVDVSLAFEVPFAERLEKSPWILDSEEGEEFYYNEKTDESLWDPPDELQDPYIQLDLGKAFTVSDVNIQPPEESNSKGVLGSLSVRMAFWPSLSPNKGSFSTHVQNVQPSSKQIYADAFQLAVVHGSYLGAEDNYTVEVSFDSDEWRVKKSTNLGGAGYMPTGQTRTAHPTWHTTVQAERTNTGEAQPCTMLVDIVKPDKRDPTKSVIQHRFPIPVANVPSLFQYNWELLCPLSAAQRKEQQHKQEEAKQRKEEGMASHRQDDDKRGSVFVSLTPVVHPSVYDETRHQAHKLSVEIEKVSGAEEHDIHAVLSVVWDKAQLARAVHKCSASGLFFPSTKIDVDSDPPPTAGSSRSSSRSSRSRGAPQANPANPAPPAGRTVVSPNPFSFGALKSGARAAPPIFTHKRTQKQISSKVDLYPTEVLNSEGSTLLVELYHRRHLHNTHNSDDSSSSSSSSSSSPNPLLSRVKGSRFSYLGFCCMPLSVLKPDKKANFGTTVDDLKMVYKASAELDVTPGAGSPSAHRALRCRLNLSYFKAQFFEGSMEAPRKAAQFQQEDISSLTLQSPKQSVEEGPISAAVRHREQKAQGGQGGHGVGDKLAALRKRIDEDSKLKAIQSCGLEIVALRRQIKVLKLEGIRSQGYLDEFNRMAAMVQRKHAKAMSKLPRAQLLRLVFRYGGAFVVERNLRFDCEKRLREGSHYLSVNRALQKKLGELQGAHQQQASAMLKMQDKVNAYDTNLQTALKGSQKEMYLKFKRSTEQQEAVIAKQADMLEDALQKVKRGTVSQAAHDAVKAEAKRLASDLEEERGKREYLEQAKHKLEEQLKEYLFPMDQDDPSAPPRDVSDAIEIEYQQGMQISTLKKQNSDLADELKAKDKQIADMERDMLRTASARGGEGMSAEEGMWEMKYQSEKARAAALEKNLEEQTAANQKKVSALKLKLQDMELEMMSGLMGFVANADTSDVGRAGGYDSFRSDNSAIYSNGSSRPGSGALDPIRKTNGRTKSRSPALRR